MKIKQPLGGLGAGSTSTDSIYETGVRVGRARQLGILSTSWGCETNAKKTAVIE